MQVQVIKTIARDMGISPGKMRKGELIRAIQREEGNFECFETAVDGFCDQEGCHWRSDCLPKPKKGKAKS